MSESKERDGVFGKYTEHTDDDGNKIGESRKRDGIFGEYTEHLDADGNKIGESRERDGVFGKYTEHADDDGNRIGESREREGILGEYTEHLDANGNKIGESRERDGVFGKYTEHTGSGFPSSTETQSDSQGEEGLIATIAGYGTQIGAIVGAIGGLAWAFEDSYGVLGYIWAVVFGAFAGGLVANVFVYMVFIGGGLFLLMAVLKACGVGS